MRGFPANRKWQTVNAIENNKYDPTLALAFRLARELKLTVDELFLPS